MTQSKCKLGLWRLPKPNHLHPEQQQVLKRLADVDTDGQSLPIPSHPISPGTGAKHLPILKRPFLPGRFHSQQNQLRNGIYCFLQGYGLLWKEGARTKALLM